MVAKSFSAELSPSSPVFSAAAQQLGTIKHIEIDNHSTNGATTIMVKDVFTPSPSVSNPNPSQVSLTRKVITVQQGGHYDSRDLSIAIYGDCYISADRDDTDVSISIDYELE